MLIPTKLESLVIIITIDSKDRDYITSIAKGLITKVDYDFYNLGYSVEDAFSVSSDNGFKGRFFIKINPKTTSGDSKIIICDKQLSEQNAFPTLESLTLKMIKAIKEREGLLSAFVDRSDIPGLEFLDEYCCKWDNNKYILK